MTRRVLFPTLLSLLLIAPVLSAQTPGTAGRPFPRLRAAVRVMRLEIRRGARAGRITPDEQAKLRTEMQGLRSQVQAIRQTGQPPTPAQRQQVLDALTQ